MSAVRSIEECLEELRATVQQQVLAHEQAKNRWVDRIEQCEAMRKSAMQQVDELQRDLATAQERVRELEEKLETYELGYRGFP